MQISLLEALAAVTKEKEELAVALATTKLQLEAITEDREALRRQLAHVRQGGAVTSEGRASNRNIPFSQIQSDCQKMQSLLTSVISSLGQGDQIGQSVAITSQLIPLVDATLCAEIPAARANPEPLTIHTHQASTSSAPLSSNIVEIRSVEAPTFSLNLVNLCVSEEAASRCVIEEAWNSETESIFQTITNLLRSEAAAIALPTITPQPELMETFTQGVDSEVPTEDEVDALDKEVLRGLDSKLHSQKELFDRLVSDRVKRTRAIRDQSVKAAAQRILSSADAAAWLNNDCVPLSDLTPEQLEQRQEAGKILREAREIQLREELDRHQAEDLRDEARTAAAAERVRELVELQDGLGRRCAAVAQQCIEGTREYERRREEVALAREAREAAATAQQARDARHESAHSTAPGGGTSDEPSDPNLRAMMKLLLPRHKVKVDRRRGQLTVDDEMRKRQEAEDADAADMDRLAAREVENEKRFFDAVDRWEEAARNALRESEKASRDELLRQRWRCIRRQQQRDQNTEGLKLLSSSEPSSGIRSSDNQLKGLLKLLRTKEKKAIDIDKKKSALVTDEETRLREEEQQHAIEEEYLCEVTEREQSAKEEDCLTNLEELARHLIKEQSRMLRLSSWRRLQRLRKKFLDEAQAEKVESEALQNNSQPCESEEQAAPAEVELGAE